MEMNGGFLVTKIKQLGDRIPSVNNLSQNSFPTVGILSLASYELIVNFVLKLQIKQVIHVEIPLGSPA